MPVFRRSRRCVVLLASLVLGGCNGNAVVSSGSPQPAATRTGSPRTSTTPSAAAPTVAPTAIASARLQLEGQIVFEDAGNDFQHTQIWLQNADASGLRQVVTDAFTDGAASLSPDGNRIVFYQVSPASLEQVLADPSLFGRIMLVDVDGTGLHELQTGNRANRCDAGPEGDAWSPDGRQIVFVTACFDRRANFLGSGIWTINADGTNAREVTKTAPAKYLGGETWASHLENHRASWSPDGKQLAFQQIDTSTKPERAAIFTIGVDGKHLRQVTPWELDGNDPAWSPDGNLIAFNASAEPSPTQNIYTIRPDGTGLAKLTTYSEQGQATYHPSWSPDGTQILFSHSPSTDGWADFFVMDRDGGNQRVIAKTTIHENHGFWGRSPTP